MFQLEWAKKEKWSAEDNPDRYRSKLSVQDVSHLLQLRWEEHCVECAVPECYTSCSLYQRRDDGQCARFEYGIVPNRNFRGRYDFGADIRFRKWGKLEANLYKAFPIGTKDRLMHWLWKILPASIQRKLEYALRETWFEGVMDLDYFIIECHSPSTEPIELIVECFTYNDDRTRRPLYRHVARLREAATHSCNEGKG